MLNLTIILTRGLNQCYTLIPLVCFDLLGVILRTWTLSQREGFSQVVETGSECENFNKYSLEASIGTIMCMP